MDRIQNIMIALLGVSAFSIAGCDAKPSDDEDASTDKTQSAQPTNDTDVQASTGDAIETNAAQAQAAQESVKQMLRLAQDGAWAGFIEGYYGEAEKIQSDQQKQALIERFQSGWGEKLIPVLKQAAELTPTIEDGKAKFVVDGETIYELHLGDDGTWGFHL